MARLHSKTDRDSVFGVMHKWKIGIVGASGYSGEELCAILSRHPQVEVVCLTSRQHVGKTVSQVFPRFVKRGNFGELKFIEPSIEALVSSKADVFFLALPHGKAAEFAAPLIEAGKRVIDISADFRVHKPEVYEEFYGEKHPAPQLLPQSVYGLPEIYREELKKTKLVASPGCYPTSILLPLVPLLKAGLIEPDSIIVSSMSGVSGAGRKAEIPFLFVECNESTRAYGTPKHRHLSEIEQELSAAAKQQIIISFTPHLIPLNRGIHSTIYVRPAAGVSAGRIEEALKAAYANEHFVRVGSELPDIKNVSNTNYCDIAVRHDVRTGRVILFSAIDNLVKGASGQAVQSMNLMAGFEETTALL
ncbi:MAG: N-acetyl-gamma-glutamyl-phosphate reductase [Chthoniobacterales bacterium]